MVFQKKSKKRMSRKNMNKKIIHRGGQDNASPWQDPNIAEEMFTKRIQEKVKDINIDDYTNEQLKEAFKNDPSECDTFRETVLAVSKKQPADKTENSYFDDEWKFILRLLLPTWNDTVESFEKMSPTDLYDTIIEMRNLALSEPSNKQEQTFAKFYYKMLAYMSEIDTLDWSIPEDRNDIPEDWPRYTIKVANRAINYFANDGSEYDPLIYCAVNSDKYQKEIDSLITMDEDGDIVFKDAVKDLQSKALQSGGNRRRRISRRRYY